MERNSWTYNRALELLFDKCPAIGLMVNSWEEEEVVEEALPELKLEKAEVLYFYGLGKGEIYNHSKEWLKENIQRKIIILEDLPGVIAAFLYEPSAIDLLSDRQVFLEYFTPTDEAIEAILHRFKSQRIEVLGLNSKGGLEELRLKLLRKSALSYALHMDRLHGYQPFQNFVENLFLLPHSFYANGLLGKFKNIPAIVCGAGPSLQKTIDTLRQLDNRALIIAGGSTLAALSSQGIMPHFGMAIDPNLEEYRRFKNSFGFEVPLLYSTRVHPGIFQTCNGPFGYMRSGIGGALELWLEEELGLLDPLLGKNLSEETVSVTGICLALAVEMGCNPVLINGVDLAYTDNLHYAPGIDGEEAVEFKKIDNEKTAADQILKRKDRLGNPIYTAVRWVMEAASISHYAKAHPEVQFINTTFGGLGFEGIEYQPIEEVVKPFLPTDLRTRVFETIENSPMPQQTELTVHRSIQELQESLARVIACLRILAKEQKGSEALAEMDLKEEMATLYLFYDIAQVLGTEGFWKNWLELALKYQGCLHFLTK
ncbi:MAG: hypothetical protein A3D96_04190 [Chlamydiae bacterium RIFCSPHIGHO2_12_FULL_44_59]|nr:MAG: hypothetical protein A2796_05680 [Chlamydiae bacterium RIFCSPHIGHO2_01_FULL_44_39]OGN58856.1 MAG: hypothetical protein A3C42_00875 [Chlamydiae bacterium RIFCSPHIGHO2_02_FULL_45_9]OGN60046.1 MAG: hypothetical protein A3D96_04190 [Chlamydiae bacterium RIFCSPHIGHO2_12_FULL_44_59]OGN66219.1 MAG: hypothetical protein A2978_06185 [Chlamydiae bacterium RIFCSPLOWO2_01_FULL_44_52]OGN68491.1 MAG: hypothetical protein A3I67_02135 [Chlamydiae bacterium RIFCSPLOWO2_02_FULL_45_22]OGN70118.1 MAG: hyp